MKNKSELIYSRLKHLFGVSRCELNFNNEYNLIVAVILSAQCTDKRVNQITPFVFEKYPNFESLANANLNELELIIKPCGFYHNKAKNLISCAKDVVTKYNGKLPQTMEELTMLNGVGRKTANVVLSNAFNIPSFAVDTHVFRVSNRLGIVKASNVEQAEKQLTTYFSKDKWIDMHHFLVLFGRYYCKARNPKCNDCIFRDICEAKNAKIK